MREIMHREIIVSGDDALSKTIAEELRGAGARIIHINTAADLLGAGVHRARAVVCAGPNDAVNLEIALLARQYSPNVRVVARLANDVLREAVAVVNGPGAILDVADSRRRRSSRRYCRVTRTSSTRPESNSLSGEPRRPTTERCVRSTPTWRRWRWCTARSRLSPGEVVPCPGRDLKVYAGDFTSMIGGERRIGSPRDQRACPGPRRAHALVGCGAPSMPCAPCATT